LTAGLKSLSPYLFMGKAVDIWLPETQISSLRRAANRSKMGGVGYYFKLYFVLVDVGSIRYWRKEIIRAAVVQKKE
jgi:uncharacterized protein YcbK (DUF882 family)